MEELIFRVERQLNEIGKVLSDPRIDMNKTKVTENFAKIANDVFKILYYNVSEEGYVCKNEQETIRQAFIIGLINNDEKWMNIYFFTNMEIELQLSPLNFINIYDYFNTLQIYIQSLKYNLESRKN